MSELNFWNLLPFIYYMYIGELRVKIGLEMLINPSLPILSLTFLSPGIKHRKSGRTKTYFTRRASKKKTSVIYWIFGAEFQFFWWTVNKYRKQFLVFQFRKSISKTIFLRYNYANYFRECNRCISDVNGWEKNTIHTHTHIYAITQSFSKWR